MSTQTNTLHSVNLHFGDRRLVVPLVLANLDLKAGGKCFELKGHVFQMANCPDVQELKRRTAMGPFTLETHKHTLPFATAQQVSLNNNVLHISGTYES